MKVVIVGAGQAGAEMATALRQQGHSGRILLLGDEPTPPYRRPLLSKAFLSGKASEAELEIKPFACYESAQIELKLSTTVSRIDRRARKLVLGCGAEEGYDKLVLATGGRARPLLLMGADASNVFYLRTQSDAERLRAELKPGRKMVVIGGGYVGLEVAASARKMDVGVTIIESASRVLARVTAPEMSRFYEGVHREAGVDIRTGATLNGLEIKEDLVRAVTLGDGTRLDADLVLIGIGLIPNTELAKDAGLEVGDGVIADRCGRTSDPDIFAIGDCALQPNAFLGRPARIESVPSAMEQARAAAATLCGKVAAEKSAPWFWSDQYDLKLQMVGISQGYEKVVLRGDLAKRSFCAIYLKGDSVIAVDAVNRPGEFLMAKRLVAEHAKAPSCELTNDEIPLKTHLATH